MENLELRHLRAIIKSRILFPHLLEEVKGRLIPARSRNKMTDDEVLEIKDECYEVWQNHSPVVYQRYQRGDCGEFPVQVYGVPGAYYLSAQEYDDEGPFNKRQSAINYSRRMFF